MDAAAPAGDGAPYNPFVPAYFGRSGYVQMGERTWLTLELPFTAAARETALPGFLGGEGPPNIYNSLNPFFLRIPHELMTQRDAYRGYELHGTALYSRQMENVLPVWLRVQRLWEAGRDGGTEAMASRVLSLFGVPVRFLSEEDMRQGRIALADRIVTGRKSRTEARAEARKQAEIGKILDSLDAYRKEGRKAG